jgi:hypothetical protein
MCAAAARRLKGVRMNGVGLDDGEAAGPHGARRYRTGRRMNRSPEQERKRVGDKPTMAIPPGGLVHVTLNSVFNKVGVLRLVTVATAAS